MQEPMPVLRLEVIEAVLNHFFEKKISCNSILFGIYCY